jgi:fluoroacetyl-CoA thioesterase
MSFILRRIKDEYEKTLVFRAKNDRGKRRRHRGMEIKTGSSARIEKKVETADTASKVSSGAAEVFSTPAMVALMENAAFIAVQPFLEEGQSTVGARIDVKHIAATPVGMNVWAEAVLTGADGRRLEFDINAFDEREKIGEAKHTRYIIDEKRFMQKVTEKTKR